VPDIEREQDATDHADQRADHADQRALDHEDRGDRRRRRASVRRIAMSATLSVTVITCADTMLNAATAMISVRMMNMTRFSICTARKKFAWLCVQSRTSPLILSVPASERGHRRRNEEIVQLQPHPGRSVQPIELLRVVEVDQRQSAVELVHPDLEDADGPEGLEARQRAGGRHRALRRNDHDRIAQLHAERARQLHAEDDPELAGLQIRERPRAHVRPDIRHGRFARGSTPE
jgi:hypothetical protein